VAVVAIHGMGQQVPFETIDLVARGLLAADERWQAAQGRAPSTSDVVVRDVKVGEERLQRVELRVQATNGATAVHLYEAYWAPLTEGQVALADVFRFLVGAGWNGLSVSLSKFRRFMFGAVVEFPPRLSSVLSLVLALWLVLALAGLNALVAGVAARHFAHKTTPLLGQLTQIVAPLPVLILATAAAMLLALRLKGRPAGAPLFRLLCVLTLVLVLLLTIALVGAPLQVAWLFVQKLRGLAQDQALPVEWAMVVWGTLLAASWIVRSFLVEYLGDVVAYVSSHSLDRFNDLRLKIKDCVHKPCNAIYGAQTAEGALQYDRVVFIAHSLGSVLAYDEINRLISEDLLAGGALRVAQRTGTLLSFGSPLDKTAFVFGLNGKNTGVAREALAAAVQPLIRDYALRPFPWVNIHSRRDIISGALDLYDAPSAPAAQRVENVSDPDACVPLVAHVEYWDNPLLFDRLRRAIA
jgi:hypothetical protein